MSRGYEDEYDDDAAPDEAGEGLPGDEERAPTGKILVPGILLIITGVVNILAGLYWFADGYFIQQMPPADFEKQVASQWSPEQRKQMEDMGWTPAGIQKFAVVFLPSWGGLSLLGSLLTIAGGACMCARRGRGLAFAAAVINVLPCVLSPCCCFGVPVGLWALIVLSQPDVRAAFRR